MTTPIKQGRDIFVYFFAMYSSHLTECLPTTSTSAYVLMVLAICALSLIALSLHELEEARLRALRPRGCRKLGLVTESNLQDEFDPKSIACHASNSEGKGEESWRVKSLWIYPVKSCRGVELDRGTVIETGMQYDRQFSFAQLKNPPPARLNDA